MGWEVSHLHWHRGTPGEPFVGLETKLKRMVMTTTVRKISATIPVNLIAPCGMNCRLCLGYIREKNKCPGCLNIDSQGSQKSIYRTTCKIRNCEEITKGKSKFCSDSCARFPCARLKQLDKRYRTKYGMSMIDNLKMINELGIRHFIRIEKVKWICSECGEMICVHRPLCLSCGHKRH
jgi:hypothetical protein